MPRDGIYQHKYSFKNRDDSGIGIGSGPILPDPDPGVYLDLSDEKVFGTFHIKHLRNSYRQLLHILLINFQKKYKLGYFDYKNSSSDPISDVFTSPKKVATLFERPKQFSVRAKNVKLSYIWFNNLLQN